MHPIYSIRPKMMFGSVTEHFATVLHENRCKIFVSGHNAQFQGTKLPKKGPLRTHPIYSNRPKTMFGCVSKHFATLLHENHVKLVFQCRINIFSISKLKTKFLYKWIQSTPLDPKWCLGVFRSISQQFSMKIGAKFVFWCIMHNFGVSNFQKMVCYERIQSTPIDPKRCLRVFRTISQHFCLKLGVKLVFQCRMHNFDTPKLKTKCRYKCI